MTQRDPVAHPWQRVLRAGLGQLRRGDFDAAERCFERAHDLAPDRAEVCCALGRERLRRGRADEAEQLLRRATEADPHLVSAAASLARCLGLELGRHDEALATLDRAEAAGAASLVLQVVRAELYLEIGRMGEARACAEAALDGAGDDHSLFTSARVVLARVENQRGAELAAGGDPAAALFAFKRAADLDPGWSAPHCNTGSAFVSLGRPERARAAFEQALALDPDSAEAARNLALLLCEHGLPGALAALERAAALRPGERAIAAALAARHAAAGRLGAALDVLGRAVDESPDDPALWLDLAALLARSDDLDGSEACLRRALALAPEDAGARRALAALLRQLDRPLEAAMAGASDQDAGADRPRRASQQPSRS